MDDDDDFSDADGDVDEGVIDKSNVNIQIDSAGFPTSKGQIQQKFATPMPNSRKKRMSKPDGAVSSESSVSPARHLRKLSNLKFAYKGTTFGGSPRGLFDDPDHIKDKVFMEELRQILLKQKEEEQKSKTEQKEYVSRHIRHSTPMLAI